MSSALVVYSWPRLWSMGTGCGSPDFYHSLLSLTRVYTRVTVVYPLEQDSQFERQVPPGIYAVGFRHWNLPLIRAPRGPNPFRAIVFSLNWLLRLLNYCSFNLAGIRTARRQCKVQQPDLITSHGTTGVPAAAWIAGSVGAPLVVRLFGVSLGIKGFSLPVLAAQFEESLGFKVNAMRWIITDDGSGGKEAALRMGVNEEYVKMIRAAVKPSFAGRADQPAKESYRRNLGLDPNALVVMRVCRLWVQQRVERMIEALPEAAADGTPVAAVIIGDGPERERLERLAGSLGKNVIFIGALPNSELSAHYAAADIYAATADRTNLSQSVLEALDHGLPVLALDTGNTSELIRDGKTGRLVAPGNPSQLRSALIELLADKELRKRLSLGARCLSQEMIPETEQRVMQESELYTELLDERE